MNNINDKEYSKIASGIKLLLYFVILGVVFGYSVYNNNNFKKDIDNKKFNIASISSLKNNNYFLSVFATKNDNSLEFLEYKNSITSSFIKKKTLDNTDEYFAIKNGEINKVNITNEEQKFEEKDFIKVSEKVIYDEINELFMNSNQLIKILENVSYKESYDNDTYTLNINTCEIIKYYNETFFKSYGCNQENNIVFNINISEDLIYIEIDATNFFNIIDNITYDNYKYILKFTKIGNMSESLYKELLTK